MHSICCVNPHEQGALQKIMQILRRVKPYNVKTWIAYLLQKLYTHKDYTYSIFKQENTTFYCIL